VKPIGCPRSWEAEAAADDRLTGEARASFERHAAVCVECRRESTEIAQLTSMMREPLQERWTSLEHARQRQALLRTANGHLVGHARPRWRLMLAATMVAGIASLVLVAALHGRGQSGGWAPLGQGRAEQGVAQRPNFDVSPLQGAVWRDDSQGAVGRVVLDEGTLFVHVHHLREGQRFLLEMPDGEIEVHGTRFNVAVAAGRTERVEVAEGVVSLRLRGIPERRMRAGEQWVRREEAKGATAVATDVPAASAPAQVDPVGAAKAPAPAAPIAARSHRGSVAASSQSGSSVGPEGHATPTVARASELFADAMDAFEASAYDRADGLLARFATDFPTDARAEDAMFLRAVARAKSGDSAGAAQRARDYLARYPNGLRRQEAEQLIARAAR
jgi:TolA-binding protein